MKCSNDCEKCWERTIKKRVRRNKKVLDEYIEINGLDDEKEEFARLLEPNLGVLDVPNDARTAQRLMDYFDDGWRMVQMGASSYEIARRWGNLNQFYVHSPELIDVPNSLFKYLEEEKDFYERTLIRLVDRITQLEQKLETPTS
jgi:hypothetical protein